MFLMLHGLCRCSHVFGWHGSANGLGGTNLQSGSTAKKRGAKRMPRRKRRGAESKKMINLSGDRQNLL